jgi:Phage tail protein (Tail_P2_I)
MGTPGPPNVTPETASTATMTLWNALPEFIQTSDAANQYTFLSWLEGIGSQQQAIDDLCRDTSHGPGWSVVMDLGRCPNYALPWLAQFVGVNIPGDQQGTSAIQDQAMRTTILAKQAFARGTAAAIVAAAQQYIGTGTVNVIERYPDPYSLTVQYTDNNGSLTYAELAVNDPTYPAVSAAYPHYYNFPFQSGATVAAAIQGAIPGGLVCTVEDVG